MPPPAKPPHNWKSTIDPSSGNEYYYNTVSGEVTWDKPEEMD